MEACRCCSENDRRSVGGGAGELRLGKPVSVFLGGAALATISQGKSDPCRLPRTRFPARRLCGGRDETERQAVAPPR
jgi:hypothetical protein